MKIRYIILLCILFQVVAQPAKIPNFVVGCLSGAGVPSSLCNQKVVGSSLGSALAATEHSVSVTITGLSKAMVCVPVYGTLHITNPLPFFKKSRVSNPVVGFSYHLIDSIIKD